MNGFGQGLKGALRTFTNLQNLMTIIILCIAGPKPPRAAKELASGVAEQASCSGSSSDAGLWGAHRLTTNFATQAESLLLTRLQAETGVDFSSDEHLPEILSDRCESFYQYFPRTTKTQSPIPCLFPTLLAYKV